MKTMILDGSITENIKLCAGMLNAGGLVAFPTETVYGLGANGLDECAVAGIFTAKGRESDNPLIVHVASPKDVERLVSEIPEAFWILSRTFWPGPLTLIMKKSSAIPMNVTSGLETVAIRMPGHPAALELIRVSGSPVAAPSANPSGRPSPTKAEHVLKDLDGKIPYILDGGDCSVGLESTVLDISGDIPRILRPGGVTLEELREVLPNVELEGSSVGGTPRSPGMRYRHYAPKAPLTAILGPPDKTAEYIKSRLSQDTAALMFDDYSVDHPNVVTFGLSGDLVTQAARLFDALRQFDSMDVEAIYAQSPNEEGLGQAIANRIKKAAGTRIVDII